MCCRLNTNISYISLSFLSIFTFKMPCVRKLKIENIRIHNENAKCTVCESAQSWLGWSIDPLANYWPLVFALRRTHVHHHHQHHDHQHHCIYHHHHHQHHRNRHHHHHKNAWNATVSPLKCFSGMCLQRPAWNIKRPTQGVSMPDSKQKITRGHTSIDVVKGCTFQITAQHWCHCRLHQRNRWERNMHQKNPTLQSITKYQRGAWARLEIWAKWEIWQGVTSPYERGIIGVCRGMSKRPSPFKLQQELIFLFENQNWNWITGVWRGMPETQSPQIIYCIFSKLKILGHTWYCKTDYIMSVLITFWV